MNIEIKNRIDKINNIDAVLLFSELQNAFFTTLHLDNDSEKIAFTMPLQKNAFRINLNARLAFEIVNKTNDVFFSFMLEKNDVEVMKNDITFEIIQDFADSDALLVRIDFEVLSSKIDLIQAKWLKSCQKYAPIQEKTSFRSSHKAELYEIFNNAEILEKYLFNQENTSNSMDFFTKEDLDLLNQSKGNKSSSSEDTYKKLVLTYNKVAHWAKLVCKKLGGEYNFNALRKPTNQANKIEHYQWAKIYPDKNYLAKKNLAFTVQFNGNYEFIIKIDTVHLKDKSKGRNEYEKFRGEYNTSKIVKIYSAQEILNKNWDYLVDLSVKNIQELLPEYEQLFQILEENTEQINTKNTMPQALNQILYGPPGTGKTYNTINKALEIIGFDTVGKKRPELKTAFDEYVKSGQIVFTTFHQSMSYEDFIEGIKPKIGVTNLSYLIEDGIFKVLSLKAKKNYLASNKNIDEFKKQKSFDDALEKYKESITKSENKHSINSTAYIIKVEEEAFRYTADNWNTEILMKFSDLLHFFEADVKLLQDIRELDNISGTAKQDATYYFNVYQQILKLVENNLSDFTEIEQLKPYILIIDEINRGNVSAIFGELITLIEDSKRLGKPEALTLTLPYSKKSFGVPPNLYIIGTMNTADRSVEALDTALRRRFVFEEMMPDYTLLEDKILDGISLKEILETINNRIEILLNRDNLIGHSYFLEVTDLESLKTTFYKNIIPLLQEYFYGDYGKIGLVLGSGFIQQKNNKVSFAKIDHYEDPDNQRVIFEVINQNSIDIQEAIEELLK